VSVARVVCVLVCVRGGRRVVRGSEGGRWSAKRKREGDIVKLCWLEVVEEEEMSESNRGASSWFIFVWLSISELSLLAHRTVLTLTHLVMNLSYHVLTISVLAVQRSAQR
jgi:hypothetical protein